MSYFNSVVLLSAVVLLLGWKLASRMVKKSSLLLPPGPPGEPIIGHMRLVARNRPELLYIEWGKEYNTDILYLNLLGTPTVVLNSAQAAIDLLDKRGAKYSDRPGFHSLKEQGWSENFSLFDVGPQFRKHRKLFHNAFTPANCIPYRAAQQKGARKLVSRLIQTPENWESHLVTFATSIILSITYGITIENDDDPWVELAKRGSYALSNGGAPGGTLVDVFPLLRKLPNWVTFIPSLKYARDQYPTIRQLNDEPFDLVKREMHEGIAKPCFIEKIRSEIEHRKDSKVADIDNVTDSDLKGAGGTMFIAGQDTTWGTISIFMLNMVSNSEVQTRAQEEIDSVIGTDRLPTFADRPNLPFVEYVVQETFRWHPVAPSGVPHKSSEDDYYKGYFIPKGTTVIANATAIHHDPAIYSSPETFDPTRYIPTSQGGRGEPFPIAHFGFGRRICPGQHLGAASVWMVIATVLATLRISKARDEQGREITPSGAMTTGVTSHPEPFACDIKPRSDKIASLVAQG